MLWEITDRLGVNICANAVGNFHCFDGIDGNNIQCIAVYHFNNVSMHHCTCNKPGISGGAWMKKKSWPLGSIRRGGRLLQHVAVPVFEKESGEQAYHLASRVIRCICLKMRSTYTHWASCPRLFTSSRRFLIASYTWGSKYLSTEHM